MNAMRFILIFAALAAGCAGHDLVPGRSTLTDVEAVMGAPADKRPGAGGETVYYYPRLPWGYETYAARIAPDGRLVALEQRLTLENVQKVKRGVTHAEEVRDLLGPPWDPMKQAWSGNEIWTYPMRVPGHPTPKWFLAHVSPAGVVTETYMIDDPNWVRQDTPRVFR
jgi:hypothetical protein